MELPRDQQQLLLRLRGRADGTAQEIADGVERGVRIADEDAEMALTRLRKVLEVVVREVHQRRLKEEPGTRPLENLIQRLLKEEILPTRVEAYASAVRKLGNVGAHTFGERIGGADVAQALAQLQPVIEWWLDDTAPAAPAAPELVSVRAPAPAAAAPVPTAPAPAPARGGGVVGAAAVIVCVLVALVVAGVARHRAHAAAVAEARGASMLSMVRLPYFFPA